MLEILRNYSVICVFPQCVSEKKRWQISVRKFSRWDMLSSILLDVQYAKLSIIAFSFFVRKWCYTDLFQVRSIFLITCSTSDAVISELRMAYGLVLVLVKSAVMHRLKLKLLFKNSVTFERRSEFWRSQCPVASYYGGKWSFFTFWC